LSFLGRVTANLPCSFFSSRESDGVVDRSCSSQFDGQSLRLPLPPFSASFGPWRCPGSGFFSACEKSSQPSFFISLACVFPSLTFQASQSFRPFFPSWTPFLLSNQVSTVTLFSICDLVLSVLDHQFLDGPLPFLSVFPFSNQPPPPLSGPFPPGRLD